VSVSSNNGKWKKKLNNRFKTKHVRATS